MPHDSLVKLDEGRSGLLVLLQARKHRFGLVIIALHELLASDIIHALRGSQSIHTHTHTHTHVMARTGFAGGLKSLW